MNANEIETTLKSMGMERGTRACLLRMAEEIQDMHRLHKEMVESMSAMATVVGLQNTAMDNMKDVADNARRHDGDERSTQELVTDGNS